MSSLLQLPFSYILWHYTRSWSDLLRLYLNFCWFLWNFFSIGLLSRTLFSPWHRLHEGAGKGGGGFLGSLIINLILRCIGFFARVFTILSGLGALALLSVLFPLFLALWLGMPFVIIALIFNGAVGLMSI